MAHEELVGCVTDVQTTATWNLFVLYNKETIYYRKTLFISKSFNILVAMRSTELFQESQATVKRKCESAKSTNIWKMLLMSSESLSSEHPCELRKPAPSWLDSSVARTLHRYRKGHGFESRSDLNFFQA